MPAHIQLKLYASLKQLTPAAADAYPIEPGLRIDHLLEQLGVPPLKAKLIFVNGVKKQLSTLLFGGERVGIFPPVGGG